MFTHQQDIVYGRKFGTALTLDIFTPAQPNGAALVFVVAGGWRSGHEWIAELAPWALVPLVERGYTVFAVVPACLPKFTIPEMLQDLHRALRFVRSGAQGFGIDSHRVGIYGFSAGGHLSLLAGYTAGEGDAEAPDPVERVSSQVQAIAQFYGPTDFLNYGIPGAEAMGRGALVDLAAAFDFHVFDEATGLYERVDPARHHEIAREISPLYAAHAGAPPTLAIHGDLDERVPLQQSQSLISRLQELGVPCRLTIKPGEGHGWADAEPEVAVLGDWFDEYLKR